MREDSVASECGDALDNELIPLLKTQQTTEVLRVENEIVRMLAERIVMRGSWDTS